MYRQRTFWNIAGTILGYAWRGTLGIIRAVREIMITIVAIVSFVFLLVFYMAMTGGEKPTIKAGSALVLDPQGIIVEQLTARDPFEILFQSRDSEPPETLMRDVVRAIHAAKDDKRISTLVIAPDYLMAAGTSQINDIGAAIDDFKESGKPVVAFADSYSQAQYQLALHADEIYLNPFGGVLLSGYGIYPLYLKSALDKIKADVHVFWVGTYKSATEPFLRDDMSDAAREAYGSTINILWDDLIEKVAARRDLDAEAFRAGFDHVGDELRAAGGDTAVLALNGKLVDGLKTRDEWRAFMIERVGDDGSDDFQQVGLAQYVAAIEDQPGHGRAKIGIVVAKGPILDGERPAGSVGGDTVARLIRDAIYREVSAIVLRIDSGGGSAFASEVIRREIEAAKAAGIPVVASMGTVAASGGYWIASNADEIWASPSTITGSIGILAVIPTFDRTADALGVHVDGVGTTPLSSRFDPLQPMPEVWQDVIQQSIEDGYEDFLERVAEGRGMERDAVDAVGQGRIWIGSKAHELGLVDHLGGLDEAVAAAARLAEVENYRTVYIEDAPSTEQQLAKMLFARVRGGALPRRVAWMHPAQQAFNDLRQQIEELMALNDPMGAYVVCLECRIR